MGSENAIIIDFLDIRLDLPPSLGLQFQAALALFEKHHDFIELPPRLKGNKLHINSTDLIALLGYLDSSELSELDQHRLRTLLAQAFERELLRSLSLDRQRHYKWCQAAVKNLAWGRHLLKSKD